MPCVQTALWSLHPSPSLDAPPADNAAAPEETAPPDNATSPAEIAPPDNVALPGKDVTPKDAALPDSSDLQREHQSRYSLYTRFHKSCNHTQALGHLPQSRT